MYQRASQGRSSGGIIPFTLSAVSGRTTINSQNCYLWIDNGTPKMHFELNATVSGSQSAGTVLFQKMMIFNSSQANIQNVLPNNLYIVGMKSDGTMTNLVCSVARSSGYVFNCNTDITLSYT